MDASKASEGLNTRRPGPDLQFGQCIICLETLWDGLGHAWDSLSYFQSSSSVSFKVLQDRFRIDYFHGFGHSMDAPLDAQFTVGLSINLVRQTRHFRTASRLVRFPRCLPEHQSLLPFTRKVSVASLGSVEFDSFLLKCAFKRRTDSFSAIVSRTMEALEDQEVETPSIPDIVQSLQRAALQEMHHPITLNVISTLLAMPGRSVQFELKRNGTTFAKLRDSARHEFAKTELLAGL